jgi:hypothetical protein
LKLKVENFRLSMASYRIAMTLHKWMSFFGLDLPDLRMPAPAAARLQFFPPILGIGKLVSVFFSTWREH